MILRAGRNEGAGLAWAAVALAFAAYLWIFLPLIPADGRGLGADYSLHLPNLLAGYFLYLQNGLLAVPWFNPGQCGGVPFIADLNVGYYSLPQFLAFVVDPLIAVRATFVVFAAIGALGFYALARRAFALSPAASAVAAVLFLFNGTFAYRMAIGHLTFHPLMLAPWIALCLIRGTTLGALLAGALFAYAFQAGMIHGIGPVAFAVAIVILIHGIRSGQSARPWIAFAGAAVVAVALSATRLAAALALAKNFPRNEYALPGFPNLFAALRVAFLSLIDLTPVAEAWQSLANTDIFLDRPEWEYAVGPIAALLIVAGAAVLVARRGRVRRHAPAVVAIAAILALPLLLNWYVPAWNALLKHVPLLGSSTTLVRWFMLYVPVAVFAAALAFDTLFPRALRAPAMALAVLAIVAPNALVEKGTYRAQRYDATPIVAAWHGGQAIPVTDIVVDPQSTPERRVRLGGNNAIAAGQSQLYCYAPVFGYQLEALPIGDLHAGPISDLSSDGALNLKNPSCYLFPGANSCRPGDAFSVEQAGAADSFVHYEQFPFGLPPLQVAANWLNLLALVGFVLAVPILMVRNRSRGAPFRGLDAMPPAR
ncbi:MAG: hypothetical protein WDM94_02540 [Bauldia sp.]